MIKALRQPRVNHGMRGCSKIEREACITLRSVKGYTDIRFVAGLPMPYASEFYDVHLQKSSNGGKLFLTKQVQAICVLIEGRFVQVRAIMRYQWKWVTVPQTERYCEKNDLRIDEHDSEIYTKWKLAKLDSGSFELQIPWISVLKAMLFQTAYWASVQWSCSGLRLFLDGMRWR